MSGGSAIRLNLEGRDFPIIADNDFNRVLGGFETEVEPNGDGSARAIKKRINWSITGLSISINDAQGDQEFITELTKRNEFFPIGITMADETIYQGVGMITGKPEFSNQSSSLSLDLAGPHELSKQ